MTNSLLSYLTVTFVVVVTPGATTTVVIQQTLRRGYSGGLLTALGAAGGSAIHALAAGLGLAVVVHQWPQVLTALRLAGAMYLCWLAVQGLRRAWSGSRRLDATHLKSGTGSNTALRQGFTVTLLNPSVATFYLAVVPSFMEPSAGFRAFALLAAIHITMAFSCHQIWSLAFDALRHQLTKPAGLRALDALAGIALLILGVGMLT